MFFLLLESIKLYGTLDEQTQILVYTSSEFMKIIKNSAFFNKDKIVFAINDNYNTIDLACKARLDLFELPTISMYNKILYLDTDIIVTGDINKMFELIKTDILYTLKEGVIDNENNYWGKILFGPEINNYIDKSAFTSGILLFNNCDKIKTLFAAIKADIITRPYQFVCFDQPYIIYNAFKYNLYDNKILINYAINNDIIYNLSNKKYLKIMI